MKKDTLENILSILRPSYRSLDVRTATLKNQSGDWENLITAIRFSCLSPKDLENWQLAIADKRGKCDTDRFKILFCSYDLDKWESLVKGLENGRYRVGEYDIHSRKNIDVMSGKAILTETYLRSEDESSLFNSLLTFEGERPDLRELMPTVLGDVRTSCGFQSLASVINVLLSTSWHENFDADCVVGLPIYVSVDGLCWRRQRFEGRLEYHEGIEDLKLDISLESEDYPGKIKDQKGILVGELEEREVRPDFIRNDFAFESGKISSGDRLCLRLYSTHLPEVYLVKKDYFAYNLVFQSRPTQMPLRASFERFVNRDLFFKMLFRPYDNDVRRGKDANEVFERAVSWLLSLFGFQVTWLGEFDKLKASDGKMELNSVDIIGYRNSEERILILVGCTTGTPDHSEVDRLKDTARILTEELFPEEKVLVKTVLFTFRGAPLIKEEASSSGVRIIDLSDLKKLTDDLIAGKLTGFLEMLEGR